MQTPFDPLAQRYPSQRFPIYARGGMVNTSSPQASAAGLSVLQKGGNAIDAAVAAAAVLTVTEPTSCGLGSDAFAIVWSARDQRLYGLNSSGPAPMLASAERIEAEGGEMFVAVAGGRVIGTAAVVPRYFRLWCGEGMYAYCCFAAVLPASELRGSAAFQKNQSTNFNLT